MMFPVDLDIKFLMKKIRHSIGMAPPLTEWQNPLWRVALTQGEVLKFLAGIDHNTPFVFMHYINIMYDINSLQGIALISTTCS